VTNAGALYDPGSAKHRFAKSYALHRVRETNVIPGRAEREPGIHNHEWGLWIPSPRQEARPGMTGSREGARPGMTVCVASPRNDGALLPLLLARGVAGVAGGLALGFERHFAGGGFFLVAGELSRGLGGEPLFLG